MKTTTPSAQPTASQHTPDYWVSVSPEGKPAVFCKRGIVAVMEAGYGQTREEDAARVCHALNCHAVNVRAVNSHAALVAALEAVQAPLAAMFDAATAFEFPSTLTMTLAFDAVKQARAALAAAKGGNAS